MIKVPRLNEKIKESVFCVDDCIATFAVDRNLIYQAMYLDEIAIEVSDEEQKYFFHFSDNMISNLKMYGGILVEQIKPGVHMMQELEKILDCSRTIMLEMRGIDCPWDWRYRKVEWGNHTFLLTGRNRNLFSGMDPYYGHAHIELPKKLLLSGFVQARILDIGSPNEEKLFEAMCKKVVEYQVKCNKGELFKNCINYQIINSIREDLVNTSCFDDYHIESNDLIQSLQNCEYSRIRFSILLQYFAEKYVVEDEIKQYILGLLKISDLWGRIRNVTIRSLISGNNDDKIIYELINQVSSMEEQTMGKLGNYLCNLKDKL